MISSACHISNELHQYIRVNEERKGRDFIPIRVYARFNANTFDSCTCVYDFTFTRVHLFVRGHIEEGETLQ